MLKSQNNDERICFRPWTKYLISDVDLPDTPQWEGTLWQDSFIVTNHKVYKILSETSVTDVSKLMSWGEVDDLAMNNMMRPVFRAAWIIDSKDQYIQWFSPVAHGMEEFSLLDGFGPDGRTTLPLLPFPMLKTRDDMFVPYHPTLEDLYAKDWIIHGYNQGDIKDQIIEKLTAMGGVVLSEDQMNDLFNKEELEVPEDAKLAPSTLSEDGSYEKLNWYKDIEKQNLISSSFKCWNGFLNWFTLDLTVEGYIVEHWFSEDKKPMFTFECEHRDDLEDMIKFIEFKTFDEIMPLNVGIQLNITKEKANDLFMEMVHDLSGQETVTTYELEWTKVSPTDIVSSGFDGDYAFKICKFKDGSGYRLILMNCGHGIAYHNLEGIVGGTFSGLDAVKQQLFKEVGYDTTGKIINMNMDYINYEKVLDGKIVDDGNHCQERLEEVRSTRERLLGLSDLILNPRNIQLFDDTLASQISELGKLHTKMVFGDEVVAQGFGLMDALKERISKLNIPVKKSNSSRPKLYLSWKRIRSRALKSGNFLNKNGYVMSISIEKVIRNRIVDPNFFIIKLFGPTSKSGDIGILKKITIRADHFDGAISKLQKDLNKDYLKSEKVELNINIDTVRNEFYKPYIGSKNEYNK